MGDWVKDVLEDWGLQLVPTAREHAAHTMTAVYTPDGVVTSEVNCCGDGGGGGGDTLLVFRKLNRASVSSCCCYCYSAFCTTLLLDKRAA